MFKNAIKNYKLNENKLIRKDKKNDTRVYVDDLLNEFVSVTTITGHKSKDGIIEWQKKIGEYQANKILKYSCDRGDYIHLLCEHFVKNKLDNEMETNNEYKNIWKHLKEHITQHVNNIYESETKLLSYEHKVAGTVDCIAEYDNKISIIDFKTSYKPKPAKWIEGYFMQCAAYAQCFYEMTGVEVLDFVIIMGYDNDIKSGVEIYKGKNKDYINSFIEERESYSKLYGI